MSYLGALEARVRALESKTPEAMTLLSTFYTGIINQVYAQTTVPGNAGVTQTPTFTLNRPIPVMAFGSMVFFTSGGTCSYCYGYLIIWDGVTTWASSNRVAQTAGGGKGDVARMVVATLPAGTYSATWQIYVDAGNTGTMTVESTAIDVFELAG